MLNLTRLINEYIYEFSFFDDKVTMISFVDYGPEQFYLQYPIYPNQADDLQRETQLSNFKEANQSNLLSTPMFDYPNGPIILQIFNQLTTTSSILEGALRFKQSFDLFTFPELYSIIADRNFDIHTSFGVLNHSSSDPLIPFSTNPEFNQTIQSVTGFSQEDWIEIMTEEQSFVYNMFLDMDVYARKQQFQNSDMLLVVYQDVKEYLSQQDQLMDQLRIFEAQIYQTCYITIILHIFTCALFSIIMIMKIMEPIAKLTYIIERQIYSISQNDIRTSFFQQLKFQNIKVDFSLKNLHIAVIEMKKRSTEQKSTLCQMFQQFFDPRSKKQSLKIKLDKVLDDCVVSREVTEKVFQNTTFRLSSIC